MLYGKSQLNGKCQIILAAIIFVGVVSFVDFAAFASEPSGKGRVIEFGWDTPTIPWLCENAAITECTIAFDGIILDLAQRQGQGSLSWIAWATNSIPFDVQQNAEEDIELLNDANFTRLRENSFFRLNSSGWSAPPDWFDADFNTVVSNITFMASAVNQTALAGIAFDPEDYFSNCWHYPGQKYSATKTFEQYQVQVRQRGREIAAAIKSACPGRDFTLLFLFANSLPYISTQWWGHPLSEDSYGLLPAFIDGLLDEAGEQIRVIDGIESAYPNKTLAEFQGSISNYQGGASLSADPSRYLSCVGIGFGTWMDYRSNDLGWYTDPNEFNLNHFTPETFNQAMDISTDLAELSWVYTQIPDWYLGTVPEAYFDALADVTGLPPVTPCIELWAYLLRAKEPLPADAAQNVHPKVVLSWEAGIKAASHDVYFGTDADAVGDANTSETLGVYVGRQDACEYAPAIFLELGQTYYWRIDEVNDANIWQGQVWSFTVVDDDGKAGNPSPANGATNVPRDTILSWSPGLVAGSHDVYLGTDYDAVNDANTSSSEFKGNQSVDVNSYEPPGLLDFGQTYYWRVDEVNPGYADSKGDVWSFTVINYAVVDDMEEYAEDYAVNIDGPWEDGYTNRTGSALHFRSSSYPVRGGEMSMEYWYDNVTNWGAGFYSEAEREYADPCDLGPRDWTASGAKALTLYFYGEPNNDVGDTEQMYVGLQDSAGLYAELRYGDNEGQDMNDIKFEDWQQWDMPLTYFSDSNFAAVANDVNLAGVEKLIIGFGIRGSSQSSGEGWVYFDDIRLYPPRCVPEFGPYADLNGNCIVDFRDVEIIADEWLKSGDVTADLCQDNQIDFKDFAVLANSWLEKKFWPEFVE